MSGHIDEICGKGLDLLYHLLVLLEKRDRGIEEVARELFATRK